MSNPNTPVDTRVAILEEKFLLYEQMMNKMESAIHTISETCQGISKMLAIHEERIDSRYREDDYIFEKIKNSEKDNKEEYEKLETRIKEVEGKIEGLTRFRWLVGGAVLLVAFLFTQGQISIFGNLPRTPSSDNIERVR